MSALEKVSGGIYRQVRRARKRTRCDDCWSGVSRTLIQPGETYMAYRIYPSADCVGRDRPYEQAMCSDCAADRGILPEPAVKGAKR